MRQLLVQVPRGTGAEAERAARDLDAVNTARWSADAESGPADLMVAHVSNARVGELVSRLEELSPEVRVTLLPQGVLPLHPPAEQAADQVTDVAHRSPLEVYLAGLQSVGSWRGFLGYAVASGATVWIGLLTDTVYLLTAAMLIAPFAGPAMNAALAGARGDGRLLGRTLLRYVGGLAAAVLTAAALTWLAGPDAVTDRMQKTAELSATALLLPLIAGAAGALNLVQSQRDSLVSGAAIGVLVAASLAPQAGVMGMAGVLGEWDMVGRAAFVLALQVIGIQLAGAAVFRLFGLTPAGARYARGRTWVFAAAMAAAAVGLAGLAAWQFAHRPEFRRSDVARAAAAEVRAAIAAEPAVTPVEVNADFPGTELDGRPALLVQAAVTAGADESAADLRRLLAARIAERLRRSVPEAAPLIEVTVLFRPDRGG